MFATPDGEKREDVRRANIRAKKYRARAAENLRLVSSLPRKKNRLQGGDGWLKPQGLVDSPGRREAAVGHQVQSSSSSRRTAGATGLLILSRCADRPARYGEPAALIRSRARKRA
jgi:hypothetical protein